MSIPARALLALIQLYKWTLSPWIGRGCRYLPTCSSYAADAIGMHGAWAGSWMALARLLRCHPLGGAGWDPTPRTTSGKWWKPWKYGDWKGGVRRADPGAEARRPVERGETQPSEICAHLNARLSTDGDSPHPERSASDPLARSVARRI